MEIRLRKVLILSEEISDEVGLKVTYEGFLRLALFQLWSSLTILNVSSVITN